MSAESPVLFSADVCVVGAGPGGLALAVALGRAGKSVIVVEESQEFTRHFRGESISPDSVWLLRQIGVLDDLEVEGIMRTKRLEIYEDGQRLVNVDFAEFRRTESWPMEIPQVMLLNRLLSECESLPSVKVVRGAKVFELLGGEVERTRGIRAQRVDGVADVTARVVVGADGRHSQVRRLAGIEFRKTPLARDFFWFRVPYPQEWERNLYRVLIRDDHHVVILPTHPDELRVGMYVAKGAGATLRAGDIRQIHDGVSILSTELGKVVSESLKDWGDVTFLDIFSTYVPKWSRGGVILIGDAAHTLSPVLGQGVNHALQDARLLGELLSAVAFDTVTDEELDRVLDQLQAGREGNVERARALQLRQEKLFAMRGKGRTRIRRALYRTLNGVRPLRHAVFGRAYFTVPQK